MVKPEIHDTNSTGATCASNKDKIIRADKSHDHGKKEVLIIKNGSENKKYRDKTKLNIISNPNLFQMNYFMIPGNCETAETPVITTSQVEETRLSENLDNDDTDEDENEQTPPNTPSLMKEIDEAIAREELGVFHVDVDEPESENEDDQEGSHDTEKEETKTDSKNKDNEDNPETEGNEVSDSDSTSTVEFTASELTERAQDLEHDEEANEVIEIDTEEEENEKDAMEAAASGIDLENYDTEHKKAQGYRGGQENLEQEKR